MKSYRVTMDRAGRWHVAFAAIPKPVPAPGNGQVVGAKNKACPFFVDAYHFNCIECHREQSGPTKCGECHTG